MTTNGRHSRTRAPPYRNRRRTANDRLRPVAHSNASLARASHRSRARHLVFPGSSIPRESTQTHPARGMASGLDALVGAATEGMRKTQSAEEMQRKENAEPKPAPAPDGHVSDSAAAPTRERKKGA